MKTLNFVTNPKITLFSTTDTINVKPEELTSDLCTVISKTVFNNEKILSVVVMEDDLYSERVYISTKVWDGISVKRRSKLVSEDGTVIDLALEVF